MSRVGAAAEGVAWCAVALAIRLVHLDHPGTYDEFYHALAARSLLGGDDALPAEFSYFRAPAFTWLIAQLFRWLGDSLWTARLPALVASAATVGIVHLTGRAVAGAWAGRIAAALLCLDPISITLSQLARFYTLHTVLFLLSSLACYRAALPDRPARRALWLAGAAAAAAAAYSLYYVTGFGLAGLLAWSALDSDVRQALLRRRRVWIGFGLATAALGALALHRFGGAFTLVRHYLDAPTFLSADRTNVAFYARFLGGHYPVLCAALPLAVLAGLRERRRFTLFAATLLGVGLLLHSGAGRKEERYVSWLMPFFYLLLGNGAGLAGARLREFAREGLVNLFQPRLWRSLQRPASAAVVAAIVAAGIVLNPGTQGAVAMLGAPAARWPGLRHELPPSDWAAARPRLEALSRDRCVLVSSAGVKALYYLGRLDYDLLRTVRDETPTGREFDRDLRTGAPVISEPASLERVQHEHGSGLVLVEQVHWRHPAFVPAETADLVERELDRIELPEEWRLLAFAWGPPGGRCERGAP